MYRNRLIPTAARVPRTMQTGVATSAMMIEFLSASITSGSEKTCWYHLVVKPSRGNAMMIESLNEKTTRISSGPYSTAPMNTRNTIRRVVPASSRRRVDAPARRSATSSTSTASAVTSARSRDQGWPSGA